MVGWWGFSPRAAVTFDPFGDGNTQFIFGFAQYVHLLANGTVNFANPNALGVTVVPWRDLNGDGQFQPGEGGFPRTRVGGVALGQVDPELSAPLSRELRLGLEQRLGDRWWGEVDLWYRKDSNLFDDVEVGLDADDFEQITVADPGPDNIPGTADDSSLTVFNQIDNFGGNELLLTNVDDKTVTYRGIDLGLRRPLADNWELYAAVTLGIAEGLSPKVGLVPGDAGGTSELFNDPNSLINAQARLFWDRPFLAKVYASYMLPYDIYLGGVLRTWSGPPQARVLPVALNQGFVEVYAEPRGAHRLGTVATIDLRVAKDFAIARSAQLALVFDLFNATNAGTVIIENDRTPNFGAPIAVLPPLVARIGASVSF